MVNLGGTGRHRHRLQQLRALNGHKVVPEAPLCGEFAQANLPLLRHNAHKVLLAEVGQLVYLPLLLSMIYAKIYLHSQLKLIPGHFFCLQASCPPDCCKNDCSSLLHTYMETDHRHPVKNPSSSIQSKKFRRQNR